MDLVAGTAVLWRGPGRLHVGGDPTCHVVLSGLTPAEQSWVQAAGDRAAPHAPGAPPALQTVPDPPGAPPIAARLRRAGLIADAAPTATACPPIRLDGIDAVTATAAVLLARTGARRLELLDDRPVDHTLGGVARRDDWARPRADALRELVRSVAQNLDLTPLTTPSLVIVSRPRATDPVVCGRLMAEDRPHLLVTLRETSADVGPLVLPGRTACAHCVDLHLTDADPAWPLLAQQMAHWSLAAPPPAQAHTAGLEAARIALWALAPAGAPRAPDPLGAPRAQDPLRSITRVDLQGGTTVVPVHPHRRCGCGATGTVPFTAP